MTVTQKNANFGKNGVVPPYHPNTTISYYNIFSSELIIQNCLHGNKMIFTLLINIFPPPPLPSKHNNLIL